MKFRDKVETTYLEIYTEKYFSSYLKYNNFGENQSMNIANNIYLFISK